MTALDRSIALAAHLRTIAGVADTPNAKTLREAADMLDLTRPYDIEIEAFTSNPTTPDAWLVEWNGGRHEKLCANEHEAERESLILVEDGWEDVEVIELFRRAHETEGSLSFKKDQIGSLIADVLGERCDQYHERCMTCAAWWMLDQIPESNPQPIYIGMDLATPGSDSTVYRCRHGNYFAQLGGAGAPTCGCFSEKSEGEPK